MKEFNLLGLRMRGADVPVVFFIALAMALVLVTIFYGKPPQVLVLNIWWGCSLVFWSYLLFWMWRLKGVSSPIWDWCPPFLVGKNLEPVLRCGVMLLLFLGSLVSMGVYLVQRWQGKIA